MGGRVSVSGLRVTLGGREILRGIDIDFAPGLLHGILGPNGCGKTTLVRALCGAASPDRGVVELDGEPLRAMPASAIARKMAVVWQDGRVTADVTVRRLVGYGRYAHLPWWRPNPASDDQAVTAAMRNTGIEQLADRRVGTLSGGERQRVWIAMALAQQPSVLLLDEPTTYLDIAHQLDVLELIRRLNQEARLTVIAVLHDLTQAARLCDRCVVMGQGAIQCVGTPAEALSQDEIQHNFAVNAWVTHDPDGGRPVIAPRHRVPARHLSDQTRGRLLP